MCGMKRIKLVDKTLPRIKLTDPPQPRIDPAKFAAAIGAVPMTDEETDQFLRRKFLATKVS
jgi:hypothetical protein